MFTKGLLVIVCGTAIAVGLLAMRQHRLTAMHDMTRLHAKMNDSREGMWDMQVRIACRIDPPKLAKAIERAKLQLEPATPGVVEASQRLTAAAPTEHTLND